MTTKQHILKTNVDSSNIDSYAYDPVTLTLTVEFKTGSVYNYAGVPEQVAIDFDQAESKGKFFSAEIRGEYDSVQLED